MGDCLVKHRHLQRQFPAGVQHEGATVKDLIVLPAHHVQIDQRQVCLYHAGNHVVHPHIHLFPEVRRAIRDQQELCPGLFQRLGHIRVPRVLADGRADADAVNAVGTVDRTAVIHALFVEDRFIGQVVLQDTADNLAAFQDEIGIVKACTFGPWTTDANCWAIRAVSGQRFDVGNRVGHKGWLHYQILQVVPGDEHLGQCQHVGPSLARSLPRRARHGGIAGKVPHGRVQLRKGQTKSVTHRSSFHSALS